MSKTEEQKRRDRERQRAKYALEHHIGEKRTCVICGSEFVAKSEKTLVCSKDCSRILSRRRTGLCNGYLLKKVCPVCGESFETYKSRQLTCSKECSVKKREQDRNHRNTSFGARCKYFGAVFDSKVTASLVIERDQAVCQICGKQCNKEDKRWGNFGPDYPTVDHIVPLSKGGAHAWSNVQCVCAMCNSKKGAALDG